MTSNMEEILMVALKGYAKYEWFWYSRWTSLPQRTLQQMGFDKIYCVERDGTYSQYDRSIEKRTSIIPSKFKPTDQTLVVIRNECPETVYLKMKNGKKLIILTQKEELSQ